MTLPTAFKPDYERYDGVPPIQVVAMRVGYVLVLSDQTRKVAFS